MLITTQSHRIAFAECAKNASRTVRAWLLLCDEPELYAKHPDWFKPSRTRQQNEYHEIARRNRLIASAHHLADRELPMTGIPLRVCVVRDPVERFLSGFTNRVLFHKTVPGIQSLDQFIERFDELERSDIGIERHFAPQWRYLGTHPEWYSHRFGLDEIHKLRLLIEKIEGRNLPALQLQQSESTPAVVPTDEQRAWIKQRYTIDYELYWHQ